jgi:hypothetical protein
MPSKAKVIVTVQGGVANVLHDETAVDVLVVDYDNAECMPVADLRCLLEEVQEFEAPAFADELKEIEDDLKTLIQLDEEEQEDSDNED